MKIQFIERKDGKEKIPDTAFRTRDNTGSLLVY